jgi:membrane-bound serine protease (ClpP class)
MMRWLGAWLGPALLLAGAADAGQVLVASIEDEITLATSTFVESVIERAEEEDAVAIVFELDTPGGYLNATKDIVASILNADVPVIVYVSPRGAWAASAGTFITMAGHVAAMAPGTSIGAAHPVFQGQGPTLPPLDPGRDTDEKEDGKRQPRDYRNEKAENFTAAFIESIASERKRNVEWAIQAVRDSVAIDQSKAVEMNVVDLVAGDLDELLDAVDGRVLQVNSREVTLATKGAQRVVVEMSGLQRFLAFLSLPQVASLLVLGALAGIYAEVQSPGLIVPGTIGVICLVLLGFSMQIIPINWMGALLLVTGIGLIVAEAFVTSFGLLFIAGLACFAIGAYMTFRVPEVSDLSLPVWSFIAPLTAALAVGGAIVVWGVSHSFRRPQYSGAEGLVGETGVADCDFDGSRGRVLVRGELWTATADEPIAAGDRVEVSALKNLVARVRRVSEPGTGGAE